MHCMLKTEAIDFSYEIPILLKFKLDVTVVPSYFFHIFFMSYLFPMDDVPW